VDATFLSNSSKRPAVQPCLVVRHQHDHQHPPQQQQQQQQELEHRPPKERLQVPLSGSSVTYTAYFRAMSRDLCGTLPQVVIAATMQPAAQQQQQQQQQQHPILNTTEVDVIPWGCAFLVGDAESDAPAVPPGMPPPNMQAAAANVPAPAQSPLLM
jgi:hypothetical protein